MKSRLIFQVAFGGAAEAVERMPVADACIKEVLRLHAPATLVFRKALQDIPVGDKIIPKVSQLTVVSLR